MAGRLLVFSDREEDMRLGEFLAFANDLTLLRHTDLERLRTELSTNPETVLLWNVDCTQNKGEGIVDTLAKVGRPGRVLAVTDHNLNSYPLISRFPVFGHHLLRRFEDPAPLLYARLVGAILAAMPFGLERYFPEKAATRRITIVRSGQKRAAVSAIQNFFVKQAVNSRLSALVAQAVDELIMNAVFDAPVLPNGLPLRRGTDRNADFELIEQEHVLLEVASGDDYVGISVADRFGSLKRDVLLGLICRDYQDQAYVPNKGDPGAGLGLHGINQSGLSLMFVCQPGVRTEVMIFFAKGASYKSFRAGFRFLSVNAPR